MKATWHIGSLEGLQRDRTGQMTVRINKLLRWDALRCYGIGVITG